jgi:hypothetical protein
VGGRRGLRPKVKLKREEVRGARLWCSISGALPSSLCGEWRRDGARGEWRQRGVGGTPAADPQPEARAAGGQRDPVPQLHFSLLLPRYGPAPPRACALCAPPPPALPSPGRRGRRGRGRKGRGGALLSSCSRWVTREPLPAPGTPKPPPQVDPVTRGAILALWSLRVQNRTWLFLGRGMTPATSRKELGRGHPGLGEGQSHFLRF